jgi:hypothetical protein
MSTRLKLILSGLFMLFVLLEPCVMDVPLEQTTDTQEFTCYETHDGKIICEPY